MRLFAGNLLFTSLASAQYIIDSSSFGHSGKISPNGHGIPGWHVSGEGQIPQLLSDKVILTLPYPGNTRGAVWSESRVSQSNWIAELEFRASGPEKAGGNLQLWYTREGRADIGTSSLYTAGNFDGLAIVIDQYGGKGGSIRGFMNDGSIDIKNHHSVDSLAFGHCEYSFRNLGRPSKLQIKQEHKTFEVKVDDKLCFSSDKIRMPTDYSFGVTAASAETPDSFEIYKFQLSTPQSISREEPRSERGEQAPTPPRQQDVPASSQYQSSDAQFKDLHDRLENIRKAVENLNKEVSRVQSDAETRHREILRGLITRETLNEISSQSQKLDRIGKTVDSFQDQFSYLQKVTKDSHFSLTEGLPQHMSNIITTNGPRMGLLIFVFVIIQIVLFAVYALYKRRSKQGPKKYL